jgi:hypothetical protein
MIAVAAGKNLWARPRPQLWRKERESANFAFLVAFALVVTAGVTEVLGGMRGPSEGTWIERWPMETPAIRQFYPSLV